MTNLSIFVGIGSLVLLIGIWAIARSIKRKNQLNAQVADLKDFADEKGYLFSLSDLGSTTWSISSSNWRIWFVADSNNSPPDAHLHLTATNLPPGCDFAVLCNHADKAARSPASQFMQNMAGSTITYSSTEKGVIPVEFTREIVSASHSGQLGTSEKPYLKAFARNANELSKIVRGSLGGLVDAINANEQRVEFTPYPHIAKCGSNLEVVAYLRDPGRNEVEALIRIYDAVAGLTKV
ncbi:MAG: hypothetical protein JNM28_01725 [Armatimonadetes bacterium]|nr:hypothetical protein [Armatimonadota bacterium]MBS1710974.1 hypothetical protein [Armatimonadota bacterium]MBX3108646.1 hypothetical protein [Fimbriimonadaceae bacterium]